MKFSRLAMGVIICAATSADAKTLAIAPVEAPIHIRLRDMEITIHSGDATSIASGINYLDSETTLTCRSSDGCAVSIHAEALLGAGADGEYGLYSLVDGLEARPPYPNYQSGWGAALQNAKVSKGKHTVQTVINNGGNPGTVFGWQVNYTLYEGGGK